MSNLVGIFIALVIFLSVVGFLILALTINATTDNQKDIYFDEKAREWRPIL